MRMNHRGERAATSFEPEIMRGNYQAAPICAIAIAAAESRKLNRV